MKQEHYEAVIKRERKIIEKILKRMRKAIVKINNALYFDDGADYGTALWQALYELNPEIFRNDVDEPTLALMDEDDIFEMTL